jgi:hypothetical protein
MSSCLELISEQFPHLRDRVACLFESDDVFRELCEDYEACVAAITRLEAADTANEPLRTEYAALRLRLETEVLRHLHESTDLGGLPGSDKRGL